MSYSEIKKISRGRKWMIVCLVFCSIFLLFVKKIARAQDTFQPSGSVSETSGNWTCTHSPFTATYTFSNDINRSTGNVPLAGNSVYKCEPVSVGLTVSGLWAGRLIYNVPPPVSTCEDVGLVSTQQNCATDPCTGVETCAEGCPTPPTGYVYGVAYNNTINKNCCTAVAAACGGTACACGACGCACGGACGGACACGACACGACACGACGPPMDIAECNSQDDCLSKGNLYSLDSAGQGKGVLKKPVLAGLSTIMTGASFTCSGNNCLAYDAGNYSFSEKINQTKYYGQCVDTGINIKLESNVPAVSNIVNFDVINRPPEVTSLMPEKVAIAPEEETTITCNVSDLDCQGKENHNELSRITWNCRDKNNKSTGCYFGQNGNWKTGSLTENLALLNGPNDSFSRLLIQADDTNGSTAFTDTSIGSHPISANGNAHIATDQSKFGGSSIYFDGSGDFLSIPDSTDWDFGAGDFTIDFWTRINGDQADFAGILSGASGDPWVGWTILWGYAGGGSTNKISLVSNASGTWQWDLTASTTVPIQNWTHVALVRKGNTLTLYQNGTVVGNTNVAGWNFNSAGTGLNLGKLYTNHNNYYHNGYIDELHISKGVARWTENFTPPSESYFKSAPNPYQSTVSFKAHNYNDYSITCTVKDSDTKNPLFGKATTGVVVSDQPQEVKYCSIQNVDENDQMVTSSRTVCVNTENDIATVKQKAYLYNINTSEYRWNNCADGEVVSNQDTISCNYAVSDAAHRPTLKVMDNETGETIDCNSTVSTLVTCTPKCVVGGREWGSGSNFASIIGIPKNSEVEGGFIKKQCLGDSVTEWNVVNGTKVSSDRNNIRASFGNVLQGKIEATVTKNGVPTVCDEATVDIQEKVEWRR